MNERHFERIHHHSIYSPIACSITLNYDPFSPCYSSFERMGMGRRVGAGITPR